jgi:hypothetical protein
MSIGDHVHAEARSVPRERATDTAARARDHADLALPSLVSVLLISERSLSG